MEVIFKDQAYYRLEVDSQFTLGLPREVVFAYKRRVRYIRSALDPRSFYMMKSLHFEKLKGNRLGQYSMRLNAQWRLIIEFPQRQGQVLIVSIVDYH